VKRVLVLVKGLGRGGAEQLLATAAPHLNRDRFDYRVAYLLPWKDALVKELADAGVPAVCLDGARGPGWVARLRELMRAERIDLVHTHSPYAAIGARLVLPGGVRLVHTEHNVWPRYRVPTRWGNAATYRRNDHVFAVSDEVRRSIRYPRGLGWRRMPAVETLYHGIDRGALDGWRSDGVRDELGIPADAPVVGTVANFKAHKGHEYLLQAARAVRSRLPEARFVLVGVGPLEPQVRRRAAELGLDGAVVFTGFREDVPRLLRSFDVFALPSIHEGLPISLLEAMALGTPAVVTDAGGIREVVRDDREAVVVPTHDSTALAAGLVSLLTDPVRSERLTRAAAERVESFDIRSAVRRMETVYEELVT
jgi:glycosyltransferase involved in cell wall biosynthesis